METEATMEEKKKSKKKGGLRTMPFIFANEVAEKLAVVGFSTNMLTYLTQQLHMPLAKAAITLTNFGGTSAMTPLVGAFLADACVGRFWTITAASVVYQVGMVLLTVSAALPQFRPPPCKAGAALRGGGACEEAAPWQLTVLYVSLFLNALGAGGYRPCIVAFGADQFDESEAAERARTWGFFNWYYFCNGASMLLAVTAVVYVQDNVGWGWGLGVPAFCMAVSVAAFVGGYPLYRRLERAGSPFTRLAQVVVAAVRKRRVPKVDDPARLYENDEMDAPISLYGKLVHTKQLREKTSWECMGSMAIAEGTWVIAYRSFVNCQRICSAILGRQRTSSDFASLLKREQDPSTVGGQQRTTMSQRICTYTSKRNYN